MNIHWKDWCWSWSSNTLATWCEELTHWKRHWCWERLRQKDRGRQMIRRLDSITDSVDMSLSKLWEIVEVRGHSWVLRPWGCKELETTEWLSDNIKYSIVYMYYIFIRFFQWTFRLLPCFGCCKTWLWALGCVYLSALQFSPGTCPGVALLDHTVALFLIFEEPPHFSP